VKVTTPVSIVVPALHADRAHLRVLLSSAAASCAEIVVAVPREEQTLFAPLRAEHPGVRWEAGPRGRGPQMNAAAAVASGRWLLFLHADCRLPDGWQAAIDRAARDPEVAGGCFGFALDDADWRARVVEFGVRLRVAVFGLPYGDQALFVRRDVFEAMGGYRDLPLMEDVDLVRRLKRHGSLRVLPLPVTTSARRWHRDGWLRRTAGNALLIALYRLGVSPVRLARLYHGPSPVVVLVLARAPSAPGKSRLAHGLTPVAHEALRAALFDDTLDVVSAVRHVRRVVACDPPEAVAEVVARVGRSVEVVAQPSGDLGARMRGAIDEAMRRGARGVVLLGSDLPDLPVSHLEAAAHLVGRPGDRIVIGPAADGGYYLVGVTAPHPELFSGIDWGTARVLEQTLQRARDRGLEVHLLPAWADVDERGDLDRLLSTTTSGATRTRAWLARYLPRR